MATTDVIYVIDDGNIVEQEELVRTETCDTENVYQLVAQDSREQGNTESEVYQLINSVEADDSPEEVLSTRAIDNSHIQSVSSIEIIDSSETGTDEEIIYVTADTNEVEAGDEVTFMQIGGPDVASEETIETSMIVEIPDKSLAVDTSPLSTDHCYTFKRGIKPKDLDKAKAKAAMLGESSPSSSHHYTFILPKNPTTQIILPSTYESIKLEKKYPYSGSSGLSPGKQTRCSKHRWLWQFMKELLFVGDPSIQWVNQRAGTFLLLDQDQLAVKWECYKKIHKMKAQVWRQMRYYFGWMEENKIVRPAVVDPGLPQSRTVTTNQFQFVEKFYKEKFLPYKFKPHTDLKAISAMAAGMDPSQDILSRYKNGLKEKVFCFKGCGSQFINKEACSRHETVCTYNRETK